MHLEHIMLKINTSQNYLAFPNVFLKSYLNLINRIVSTEGILIDILNRWPVE